MKKIILTTLVIVTLFQPLVAQVQGSATPVLTTKEKADQFFLKAKHHKNAAWGLLGGGGALVLIGVASFPKDYSWWGNTKETESKASISSVIFGVGGLAMLGSIPYFISAGVKKNKARLLMDTEKLAIPTRNGHVLQGKIGVTIPI